MSLTLRGSMAGEHEPSLTTLSRLASRLCMVIQIDITPTTLRLSS